MAVISMSVQTRDTLTGDVSQIAVTYLNPELFPEGGNVPETSYQAADNVGRRLAGFSNNTYVDTIITRTESVTEILNA